MEELAKSFAGVALELTLPANFVAEKKKVSLTSVIFGKKGLKSNLIIIVEFSKKLY